VSFINDKDKKKYIKRKCHFGVLLTICLRWRRYSILWIFMERITKERKKSTKMCEL